MPSTVRINMGEGYNVKIRRGIVERLCLEVLRLNEGNNHEVVIITDEKVSELYLQKVIMNFQECPKPEGTKLRICELLIDSHECAKNFGTVSKLLEDIASLGLSKNCIIVALGGSVVCDASGFAAGCYMGGVKLVLVPTTLAAMIDVSAGGSALLNLNAGKNLAGMSYNPSLVLCDTDCLKTLSTDEYNSGIAEALKTAIMSGEELFRIFERGEAEANIEKVIDYCIKYRAGITRTNCLAYELGNAIESLSGYEIRHGDALSSGIGIIVNASLKMKQCDEVSASRIFNALKLNNLPLKSNTFRADTLAQAILNGRKVSGGDIELLMPFGIGDCRIMNVEADELKDIISLGMQ